MTFCNKFASLVLSDICRTQFLLVHMTVPTPILVCRIRGPLMVFLMYGAAYRMPGNKKNKCQIVHVFTLVCELLNITGRYFTCMKQAIIFIKPTTSN